MTLREAITALLVEYELEGFDEVFRDDAKQDRQYTGLSENHPKVQKFRQCCQVLRDRTSEAVMTELEQEIDRLLALVQELEAALTLAGEFIAAAPLNAWWDSEAAGLLRKIEAAIAKAKSR